MEKIIHNEKLGDLNFRKINPDDSRSWINGGIEWCGKAIYLMMFIDDSMFDDVVNTAVELIENQEKWNALAYEYLADNLMDKLYSAEKVSREEFMKSIELFSVNFRNPDSFRFEFIVKGNSDNKPDSIFAVGNLKDGFFVADAKYSDDSKR